MTYDMVGVGPLKGLLMYRDQHKRLHVSADKTQQAGNYGC